MTLRKPLVLDASGKPAELPYGDSIGGAAPGTNGTNGADGGAVTIPYTFSTTTTDADPGTGNLRLNNATENSATQVFVDLLDANGVDWTSVLDTLDASTNTVKGIVRLVKKSDATKFLVFNLTARTTATGYRKFTLSNTGSSASSPFSNGDSILLCFDRVGDKGADGTNGTNGTNGTGGAIIFLEKHTASNSSELDFTAWYSSTYDEYIIEIVDLIPASSGQTVSVQFSSNTGSTYDTTSGHYQWSTLESSSFGSGVGGNQSTTSIGLMRNLTTTANLAACGAYRLYGPAASVYKKIIGVGSVNTGTGAESQTAVGIYASTSAVDAFKIFMSSGNISSGEVRVYGVAKA